MGLPTFRFISGRSRGLGASEASVAYAQIGTSFRHFLHYFDGKQLPVFLSIALSADASGWADKTAEAICDDTGLDFEIVDINLSSLLELTIDGHRVLLYGAQGYLIFPSPSEVEAYEIREVRQQPQGVAVVSSGQVEAFDFDSDESIGLFTEAHAEKIRQAKVLPFVQPNTTDALIQPPSERRKHKRAASKKPVDPLFHVVQDWWQDAEHGAGRVIVDYGRDGTSTNRIVETVRGLQWSDAEVVTFLQECYEYWMTGPESDFWATKITLGTLPDRIQVWWSTIKQKQIRQQQREAHEQRVQRLPVVPRRKVAS